MTNREEWPPRGAAVIGASSFFRQNVSLIRIWKRSHSGIVLLLEKLSCRVPRVMRVIMTWVEGRRKTRGTRLWWRFSSGIGNNYIGGDPGSDFKDCVSIKTRMRHSVLFVVTFRILLPCSSNISQLTAGMTWLCKSLPVLLWKSSPRAKQLTIISL